MRARGSLLFVLLVSCSASQAGSQEASPAKGSVPPGAPVVPSRPDAEAPAPPAELPLPPSGLRMGAFLEGDGATFRVWAPNAQGAAVEGEFGERPLSREEGGRFAGHVPGVRAGDLYHFVLQTPEGPRRRLDPYGRQIDGEENRVVDPRKFPWKFLSFVRPRREETVLYELHVGSFAAGEGASPFAGVAARLPHLAALGVNALELMPVHASGGSAGGWGYNPQAYFAPKPGFGSPDELRGLVDSAHGLGMGVLLDVVYNHYDGWPKANLRCFDGRCPDGSAGIYFFEPGPWASTPWGPRPAYARREVRDLLLDSADQFLTEYRGDGFRWDSVSNIRGDDGRGEAPSGKALLTQANDWTHARGALSFAEDLKGFGALTEPVSRGGFGFDGQWDGFGYTLTEVLAGESDDARDLGRLEGAVRGGGDPFARVLFLETHDTVGNGGARLPQRIDPSNPRSFAARKRALLGAVVLLTAPGVPMLFQGQEMLATGTFNDPPAPLDWSLVTSNEKGLALYRDAIRLRRNLDGASAALASKEVAIVHRHDQNKVLAYRRGQSPPEDVLVVVNLRNRGYTRYDVGSRIGGAWQVRIDTDLQRYGDGFGQATPAGSVEAIAALKDGLPFTIPVRLGPYSAVVLTRR